LNPFDSEEELQIPYLMPGVVVDNVDPKGVGCVRLEIPGLVNKTDWAYPIGTLNGGGPQRGAFFPPEVGADVAVLFLWGNPDHPYYLGGYWGSNVEDLGTEAPTGVKDVPIEDRPKMKAIETEKFLILIDDRTGDPNDVTEGKERLLIKYKDSDDDFIEIDGLTRGIQISGTSVVRIQAVGLIELDALQIQFRLGGGLVRRIAPSTKDI
jgi:hypothetical protein